MIRRVVRRMLVTALALTVTLSACSAADPDDPEQAAEDRQAELPAGWSTSVVSDERVGDYVLAVPDPATVWLIGDDVDQIAEATAGTRWAGFWVPALDAATSDRSNVRAVVVDTEVLAGEVVSFHVNVNSQDPGLDLEDAEQLADQLQGRFAAQGLEVRDSGTTRWQDRTVAEVAFRVPPEVFDGEIRYVRQWFIPQSDPPVMWSFTCDSPDQPEASDLACRTALDGFWPAPSGAQRAG